MSRGGSVARKLGNELVFVGKKAALVLVPHLNAVSDDGEHAASAADELYVGRWDGLPDFRGQPGRARLVVSNDAVFDCYVHHFLARSFIDLTNSATPESLLHLPVMTFIEPLSCATRSW